MSPASSTTSLPVSPLPEEPVFFKVQLIIDLGLSCYLLYCEVLLLLLPFLQVTGMSADILCIFHAIFKKYVEYNVGFEYFSSRLQL